ncbi:MAG: GNAT family N-acetyltransferase [Verrucomicrobiales bacterium]
MTHLSFPEFLSRREAFDAAVAAQDEIAKFCSSSSWMCAANGLLHASGGEGEPEYCIREQDRNWIVFVDRQRRGIWFPLESAWMFDCPMIGETEKCIEMLRKEGAASARPTGFCIGGVRKDGELHRGLLELGKSSFRYEEFPATDCMVINLRDGFGAWLGRRSKKFRKSIRQLPESDDIEVLDASAEAPETVFRRILAIQRQTYKWREGTDIFQGEEYVLFYRYLIDSLSEAGRLRILFAGKEGEDVAYILGAEFANQYRGLQMSFIESARSLGIGNRLQLENLRRCAESGLEEYDLGMHSEYKERWADRRDAYITVFLVL